MGIAFADRRTMQASFKGTRMKQKWLIWALPLTVVACGEKAKLGTGCPDLGGSWVNEREQRIEIVQADCEKIQVTRQSRTISFTTADKELGNGGKGRAVFSKDEVEIIASTSDGSGTFRLRKDGNDELIATVVESTEGASSSFTVRYHRVPVKQVAEVSSAPAPTETVNSQGNKNTSDRFTGSYWGSDPTTTKQYRLTIDIDQMSLKNLANGEEVTFHGLATGEAKSVVVTKVVPNLGTRSPGWVLSMESSDRERTFKLSFENEPKSVTIWKLRAQGVMLYLSIESRIGTELDSDVSIDFHRMNQ